MQLPPDDEDPAVGQEGLAGAEHTGGRVDLGASPGGRVVDVGVGLRGAVGAGVAAEDQHLAGAQHDGVNTDRQRALPGGTTGAVQLPTVATVAVFWTPAWLISAGPAGAASASSVSYSTTPTTWPPTRNAATAGSCPRGAAPTPGATSAAVTHADPATANPTARRRVLPAAITGPPSSPPHRGCGRWWGDDHRSKQCVGLRATDAVDGDLHRGVLVVIDVLDVWTPRRPIRGWPDANVELTIADTDGELPFVVLTGVDFEADVDIERAVVERDGGDATPPDQDVVIQLSCVDDTDHGAVVIENNELFRPADTTSAAEEVHGELVTSVAVHVANRCCVAERHPGRLDAGQIAIDERAGIEPADRRNSSRLQRGECNRRRFRWRRS